MFLHGDGQFQTYHQFFTFTWGAVQQCGKHVDDNTTDSDEEDALTFFFSFACHEHNWSATKRRLHPQSVVKISRHSVLSWDWIRQCETSSGSRHKDTDQQRPLLPREVKTRFNDSAVTVFEPKPKMLVLRRTEPSWNHSFLASVRRLFWNLKNGSARSQKNNLITGHARLLPPPFEVKGTRNGLKQSTE